LIDSWDDATNTTNIADDTGILPGEGLYSEITAHNVSVSPEPGGKHRNLLTIIGSDNSRPVDYDNPSRMPTTVQKHAQITARILTGDYSRCTGTLIGKNLLLTNAHCFFNNNGYFDYSKLSGSMAHFEVKNGRSERSTAITSIYYSTNFPYADTETTHDYAIAVLESNMGNIYGWAGIKRFYLEDYEENCSWYTFWQDCDPGPMYRFYDMSLVGFHGSPMTCSKNPCYQQGSYGSCRLDGLKTGRSRDYAGAYSMYSVKSTCDTAKGGSGSAFIDSSNYVVALNWGSGSSSNSAVPTYIFIDRVISLKSQMKSNEGFYLMSSTNEYPEKNPTWVPEGVGI
ncbi:MAG: trypsin-like serine protease, partial [Bacteroidota bacterium]